MTPSRNDDRFKELLTEAFPAGEPSQQLRERVASGAHTQRRALRSHRGQALRLVGATVLALVCGVGLLNWTRWVAAEPLRRMQAALEKVDTLYQKVYMLEPASELEQWDDVKTGWFRRLHQEREPHGTLHLISEELLRDGERWVYDCTRKEVTHQKYVPNSQSKRTGFTIMDIRRDLMKTTGEYTSFTDLGTVTKDSRTARKYRLVHNETGNIIRSEYYVDPRTDLPFHGEISALRRGEDQWKLYATLDLTYNAVLPSDIFALNFPKTIPWRDLDWERDQWQALLAKGIARKTTESGRAIVLRNFHISPEGDVLILYTAGPLPEGEKGWHTTLKDDQGTTYYRYGQSIMGAMQGGKPVFPGTVYEDAGLIGEGWVATTPQSRPWQARTFTLTFRSPPQSQPRGRGNSAEPTEKTNQTVVTYTHQPASEKPDEERTEKVTFSLPISGASEEMFPAFLSQLPWPYGSEVLEKLRARARGELEPGVKASPERLAVLSGVNDTIQALIFSPDGRTLISSAWKDRIRLWDVATGKQTASWASPTTGVNSLAFTQDGQQLAVSGMVLEGQKYTENRIQMRSFPAGNPIWQQRIIGEDYGSTAIAFSPDGSQLCGLGVHIDKNEYRSGHELTAAMSSRFWVWDAQTGKQLQMQTGTSMSPGDERGFVDVSTGRETTVPSIETNLRLDRVGFSDRIAISHDGTRVAAIGTERQGKYTVGSILLVWDAVTGKRLQTFRLDSSAQLFKIVFSPDGNYIAGTNDSKILLWNLQTGRLQTTLIGHGRPVMELAFSPDGRLLASGDLGGGLMLWRMSER